MTMLNWTLPLALALALSQFACGVSSYKSLVYEKQKLGDAKPSGSDVLPALPEESLDAEPLEEPAVDDEELPAVEQPCVKDPETGKLPVEGAQCPPDTKKPDAPKNPETPKNPPPSNPPVGDDPSQN